MVTKTDNEITPTATNAVDVLLRRTGNIISPKVPQHAFAGDALAIVSSLCYAIYTLLLKV